MQFRSCFVSILVLIACSCSTNTKQKEISLFDGETLRGWDGDSSVFRVSQNTIIGGNLKDSLNGSYYLCTEEEFKNFSLTLDVKLTSESLFSNSGISFRAHRTANGHEVAGYQADIGYIHLNVIQMFSNFDTTKLVDPFPLWGCLVDESRTDPKRYPNPEIAHVAFLALPDPNLIEEIINKDNWNELQIIAHDRIIKIFINNYQVSEFIENDIETSMGAICLQVHSGGPFEIRFRNIRITEI